MGDGNRTRKRRTVSTAATMRHCVISCRGLLWALLTVATALLMLAALLTPAWIVASRPLELSPDRYPEGDHAPFRPSAGVFNRCMRINGARHCASFALQGLATPSRTFPTPWKASLVLLSVGLGVLALTALAAPLACAMHGAMLGRSLYTLIGCTQAIAGILFILGLLFYPFGWSAGRVQRLCGHESTDFYLEDCSIGWALYASALATALTFCCAALTVPAQRAAAGEPAMRQADKGRSLVCVV